MGLFLISLAPCIQSMLYFFSQEQKWAWRHQPFSMLLYLGCFPSFLNRVSIHSSFYPGTHYVAQVRTLGSPPLSASDTGVQVYTTTSRNARPFRAMCKSI